MLYIMEKTTWDHIHNTFDDLSDEQFKLFTDKLVDSRMQPRTRRNAVEGKDRSDVARHIIDNYTETSAIDVTVLILKAIGCSNAAQELEGLGKAGTPSSANISASGTSTTANISASACSGAAFIDAKWSDLVQRTTGLEAILDILLMRGILTDEEYSNIMAEHTQQKMMRALIIGPMRAAGDGGKNALYEILMKQKPYMMKDLGAQ
uniref:CARD domain-containing protein n=2 Tax=Electrophorus electricus TaxID=8005 RepID=A0A4W4FIR6_ELEEL